MAMDIIMLFSYGKAITMELLESISMVFGPINSVMNE